jgi:hypothetical protein
MPPAGARLLDEDDEVLAAGARRRDRVLAAVQPEAVASW